jgi:hypothetical protein
MPIVELLLFVASAAMAWFGRWQAGDLVWGLWLSSLVVGYGLLLTGISTPVLRGDPSGWGMGQDGPPDRAQRAPSPALSPGRRWIVRLFELPVALFLVSQLLLPARQPPPTGDLRVLAQDLRQVVITRWPFLVLSIISARDAFAQAAVAFTPMTSYRNVLRMHLLIFFFAFAKIVHLDGRLVYLAVLFVYFYPWEAMRGVAGLGPRT